MKPYFQDSLITLYNADCRKILPQLEKESVDIVFTDPPYGHNNNNGDLIHKREAALGKKKTASSEARPIANDGMDEMKSIVDFALTEFSRLLRKDCCCCCCCCCGGGGPKPTFAWVADRMDQKGLAFFHAVVWDKGGLGMGWRYRRNYEFVMVSHRKGGRLKWESESSGEDTANVVRINKIIPSKDDHPTPKPIALVRHFLKLHGKSGDVLLDPFAGAGVTLLASAEKGIRAIGIEIEPRWCELFVKRYEKLKSQPDMFQVKKEEIEQGILI